MKLENCKISQMHYDFVDKHTKFEFSYYGDITPNLEEFLGQEINIEVKGAKRSNNANRLFVELVR